MANSAAAPIGGASSSGSTASRSSPRCFKFRDDQGHEVEFTAPYVSRKLKRTKPLAVDEFEFLNGTPRR